MLKIRLSRVGKRNSPIYRLVVAEKSRAVKREYIEILGLYNPTDKSNKFNCKKDRVEFWLDKGAKPSETVQNLLCDFGFFPKDKKLKIVYGKKQKKKDLNKETGKQDGTQKTDDTTTDLNNEQITDAQLPESTDTNEKGLGETHEEAETEFIPNEQVVENKDDKKETEK